MLARLKELGVTAKPSKCEWAIAMCTYPGYTVGDEQVALEHGKVKMIKQFL